MTSTTSPRPNHSRNSPQSHADAPPWIVASSGGPSMTSSESPTTIGVYTEANREIRRSIGAARLVGPDLVHDPGDQRVAHRPRRQDLQRPLAVDRTGVDRVTRLSHHGDRLPRDRLLVDARTAREHLAVDRDRVAGADQQAIAVAHLAGRHDLDRAIGP